MCEWVLSRQWRVWEMMEERCVVGIWCEVEGLVESRRCRKMRRGRKGGYEGEIHGRYV